MQENDPLGNLDLLGAVSGGPTAYYRELLRAGDAYLITAAWCRLIEAGAVSRTDWPALLDACEAAAVAKAAFEYFEGKFEHELAADAAARARVSPSDLRERAFRAQLALDHAAAAEVQAQYFLETDEVGHLVNAASSAELASGWRGSLAWNIRAALVAPLVPDLWGMLLLVLYDSAQKELLDRTLACLGALGLHDDLRSLFTAASKLLGGDPLACLELLTPFDQAWIDGSRELQKLRSRIQGIRADALHAAGKYSEAYAALTKRHDFDRLDHVRPSDFATGVLARSKLVVPSLPADLRNDVHLMLGFPRSGTTLLENALATHGMIETFEEVPSQFAMLTRLANALAELNGQPPSTAYLEARKAYYNEIDRRRRKSDATVLIDKLPIASSEAHLFQSVFPDRRYIFSVRHPFDVVLSCLRQTFKQNAAMANFLSLRDAVATYDLTMSQWFGHFSLNDPRVVYVRYDDLVLSFEATLRHVVAFLGLQWDPGVNDFAEASKQRSARTPSYQKVRQGLSIGVQTAWRNYAFLFEMPEAQPLHKWAEFFGYPTK